MMTLQTLLKAVSRSQINSLRMLTTTVHNCQKAAEIPATAHTHGTCGIPKWVVQEEKVEVKKMEKLKLPSHLIRPPCLPGGKLGESQTCLKGGTEGGLYCVPCRSKYKYTSFSDNIDSTAFDNMCWWGGKSSCHQDDAENVLSGLTRQCVEELPPSTYV